MFVLVRLDLRGFGADLRAHLELFHRELDEAVVASVREIVADVRARGDQALRDLTVRFDGCQIDELRVEEAELAAALASAPGAFREALELARDRIWAVHDQQKSAPAEPVSDGGLEVRDLVRPVERAGLYVPGGRAAYPSTALMTAIPAQVAGVREIALCVPPDRDGMPSRPTLAAAALLGLDEVYRVGGAQAIAALAYGTETIPSVDVVVGPGNQYVAAAKHEVAGQVGIDGLAGPSELVVVADSASDPRAIAADLMAQSEHGPGGTAVVVTWDPALADAVDAALDELLADAPRRSEIEATFASGGRSIVVDGPEAAVAVANAIAPEHLELMNDDPESLLPLVDNAGAVFCGPWAPAVVGDYLAGTNHVLPTGGTARFAGSLGVSDFEKHVHVVTLDRAALARLAPHIQTFADVEGLPAHGESVRLREADA